MFKLFLKVVRTDLKELQQFDLGGAPYGYTPFCESRREMDGFRFWKQGYWRNHLQVRISKCIRPCHHYPLHLCHHA